MSEELIYLYRRKGQDAWVTCDAERYAELSTNHFFEVRVARDQYDYAALEAECERLRSDLQFLADYVWCDCCGAPLPNYQALERFPLDVARAALAASTGQEGK